MSPLPLAAAAENREASPIGLVVILLLVVALVLLIRSMNRHLRKVPGSFSGPESRTRTGAETQAETRARPAGETVEDPRDPGRPSRPDPGRDQS